MRAETGTIRDRRGQLKHEFLSTENLLAFSVILLSLVLFFGAYTRFLQQTDTYAKWFYTLPQYRRQYQENVRLCEWAYMEFFYRVMGEPQHFRAFHVCVGIAVDAVETFILWKVICHGCRIRERGLRLAVLLPAVMLRANVFYSDIFQYGVDAAPMFLGDLLAVWSALALTGCFCKRSRVLAVLLLALSLMFRQTCLFWFVFTGLFLAFCETDKADLTGFLRRMIPLVVTALLAALPVLLLINFWSPAGSRGSFSRIDLVQSLTFFRTTFRSLLYDCCGVQPPWFYTCLLVPAILMNTVLCLRISQKEHAASGLVLLLREWIVVCGVMAGTFFTVLFVLQLPHRTTYGFATLLPLWLLFPVRYREYWEFRGGKLLPVLCAGLLFLNLAVNFRYTRLICEGLAETNRVDQEDARYYYRLIRQYEEDTGTEITKVAWHYDEDFTAYLPDVIGAKTINMRACSADWSRKEIFPFTVGRRFQVVPFDEDLYRRYFAGKDWDGPSEEQLLFVDDTVCIVLY